MLHIACLNNNIKVVDMLISHGLNINDQMNFVHLTPLMIASEMNYKEIVELLISRGANINIQDTRGNNVIHHAITHYNKGLREIVNNHTYFVKLSEDYINSFDKGRKVNDLIELLLSIGADINAKNHRLDSPLHVASFELNSEIAEMLISHGANINDLNGFGMTPLDVAIHREKEAIDPLDISQKANKIQNLLRSYGGRTKLYGQANSFIPYFVIVIIIIALIISFLYFNPFWVVSELNNVCKNGHDFFSQCLHKLFYF
ncbi:hypothetical protein TVAG_097550 [Trichomonas vaginalis G3]|uniref:Uncharacterized protein n=1 Tax=Trichomonas vaginalis (strain ATCC PRA-98 / G3) TaxID=412133 RepID=A2E287_TRIV3|nr:spectrin binding [Trichomonas vaginalis G3]EAY13187.1 hypothetical protein TVAG_097550 [Trichomonas vaginalis G3]KAI5488195.1 spectrin binding [Trichomonas vaginalis G3]|eukprot:XP_001325410.1 hypothetical protein [Trichomonas vaginalis G3]